MKTVPLGKTGVHVSAMCLGTMYFGSRIDEPTSYRLLDRYLEAGGTFLDTANIYAYWVPGCAGGESESLLGRWIRNRGNRHSLFIATKVGFEYQDVKRGLRADQIEAECDKSLKRMGIDAIDLYYAHVDDRATRIEETLEAFERLVRAGKVRFIGASNFRAWRLEVAHWISRKYNLPAYCCIQQRHTYLQPRPGSRFDPQVVANEDLFDYCRNRDITFLAYTVLLEGAYTRSDRPLPDPYLHRGNDQRLGALRAVAREIGATPNQVVLAWMLHSDPPVLPLIAASTLAQLDENLGALDITLTADQMARLIAVS